MRKPSKKVAIVAGAVGIGLAAISERSAEVAHLALGAGGRGFKPRRSDQIFHGAIVQRENSAFARRQRGFDSHWLHHFRGVTKLVCGGMAALVSPQLPRSSREQPDQQFISPVVIPPNDSGNTPGGLPSRRASFFQGVSPCAKMIARSGKKSEKNSTQGKTSSDGQPPSSCSWSSVCLAASTITPPNRPCARPPSSASRGGVHVLQ